ncbi:MAG: hypothetical protein GX936_02055 [Clostridiales bacterium]|nr:hypothetical protein [Clostridiales bacterium]
MEISISHQLIQAASSLFLGAAAGFLYDFFRVVRHRTRSKTVTAVTDFLFWVIVGIALFLLGLSLGEGRHRIFMHIIAILGGILYFCTLSRFTIFLYNKLANVFVFIFFCLSRPFVWSYMVYKKIKGFLKNIFHYQHKWFRIYADNILWSDLKHSGDHNKDDQRTDRKEGVIHEAEKGRYYYEDSHIRSGRVRVGDSHQPQGSNRRRPLTAAHSQRTGDGKRNVNRRTPIQNWTQRG